MDVSEAIAHTRIHRLKVEAGRYRIAAVTARHPQVREHAAEQAASAEAEAARIEAALAAGKGAADAE